MFATALSSIKSFVHHSTAGIRKGMDKKALKARLLDIKESAREYEKAKLPAGHEFYQKLLAEAKGAIKQFADTWDENATALEMEFPFLYTLEKKANPTVAQEQGNAGKIIIAFILVILTAALIGAASGIGTGVSHMVKGWFGG